MSKDRKDILLRATYDLLKKQKESSYVLNMLDTTAIWDDVECDGYCLFDEIAYELNIIED